MRQLGDIKLYDVDDLHELFDVNSRIIRDWFNSGKLRGKKIGKRYFITEENLRLFIDDKEGGGGKKEVRANRKTGTKQKKEEE